MTRPGRTPAGRRGTPASGAPCRKRRRGPLPGMMARRRATNARCQPKPRLYWLPGGETDSRSGLGRYAFAFAFALRRGRAFGAGAGSSSPSSSSSSGLGLYPLCSSARNSRFCLRIRASASATVAKC